jgi:hypothetical protein
MVFPCLVGLAKARECLCKAWLQTVRFSACL